MHSTPVARSTTAAGPFSRKGRRGALRRSVRVFSALALVTSLAACASGGTGGGGGGGEGGGPVEITYGLWDEAQVPAMEQIIEEFEAENENITVRIALTPWEQFWTKMQTAASGGSAPDVFWMMIDRLKYYADGGALLPLSDRIEEDGFDMGNFVDAAVSGATHEDEVYGIPKDINSFGLFYNKTLFEEAGVDAPDESWTWETVADAAEQLTDEEKGVYGIAAPLADVLGYYLTIPQTEGGHVISEDGTTSGYDDPATIAGLQYWVDFIEAGTSPTAQQMAETDPESMFTSGKVAMLYGGSWNPIGFSNVDYANENIDVAPLPQNDNRNFFANGIENVAFNGTKHPDEAWEFLKFLGSERANQIQAETGTVIPAFKGSEQYYVDALPQFDLGQITDQLPNGLPIPSSLNTAVWSDFAIEEFAKAWSGETTVEESAKVVAEFMNETLAEEGQ